MKKFIKIMRIVRESSTLTRAFRDNEISLEYLSTLFRFNHQPYGYLVIVWKGEHEHSGNVPSPNCITFN